MPGPQVMPPMAMKPPMPPSLPQGMPPAPPGMGGLGPSAQMMNPRRKQQFGQYTQ